MGGGQRNLLDLLPAVLERGWEALVAAPGVGPLFRTAREAGAETKQVPFGNYTNGRKALRDGIRFIYDTACLQRWVGRQAVDVISVGGTRMLVAAAIGSRNRPVIFQAQHHFDDPRVISLAAWAIRHSAVTVVANSKHVATQFEEYANVRIVYNGVTEIPFALRDFGGRWRIGIIGRIAPMKGQTDFLRAAAAICRRLPGSRFIICGAPMFCPRSYVEEVSRLAGGLPVEFLGWREDIGKVLQELDLLLVPSSKSEATTRVILEAFSAGVPVVAYAIAGIPEIIRDGKNGFLVAECEPLALARRVLEVTAADLKAIARAARKDWEAKYSVARYREQMASILNEYAVSGMAKSESQQTFGLSASIR